MTRIIPKQRRSRITEQKFLCAFAELIRLNGFANTTIDDVATLAGQTRSAFLKRFGSKQGALEVLFKDYCQAAMATMRDVVVELEHTAQLHSALLLVSKRYEALLQTHKASNRAMHEHFMQRLEIHDFTKDIFRECVGVMMHIQQTFLEEGEFSKKGAWSATQLLVTLNYNHMLHATPGFPSNHSERHHLIADLLETALRH